VRILNLAARIASLGVLGFSSDSLLPPEPQHSTEYLFAKAFEKRAGKEQMLHRLGCFAALTVCIWYGHLGLVDYKCFYLIA
jgi:hypothetical protein